MCFDNSPRIEWLRSERPFRPDNKSIRLSYGAALHQRLSSAERALPDSDR